MTPAELEDLIALKWVIGFSAFLVIFAIGVTGIAALG